MDYMRPLRLVWSRTKISVRAAVRAKRMRPARSPHALTPAEVAADLMSAENAQPNFCHATRAASLAISGPIVGPSQVHPGMHLKDNMEHVLGILQGIVLTDPGLQAPMLVGAPQMLL